MVYDAEWTRPYVVLFTDLPPTCYFQQFAIINLWQKLHTMVLLIKRGYRFNKLDLGLKSN